MRARDVSNIWWAFVTLELAPGDASARRALGPRVRAGADRVPRRDPADVANQSWALAAR